MHRLQTRIILFYVLFIVILLFVSGYLLQWSIQSSMEAELGAKLTSVASSCVVMFDEDELTFLPDLQGSRLKERFESRLNIFKATTHTKRVFLFIRDGEILLDTETSENPNLGLTFFSSELDRMFKGESIHSILFTGMDGKPSMTGFAPVRLDGKIIAGIGVEGSVPYLESLRHLQRKLIGIFIGSLIAAISLGIILARTITQPVRRLSLHSQKIADGDYSLPVAIKGKDEISHLAGIMEDMRQNILHREEELKAMVAGVAHEIRNPLGGMELFSDLLKDEISGNAPALGHLDRIRKELNHLKSTVNRFLDFARPQHPQFETIDIHKILDETLDLLGETIQTKNIKLVREIPKNLFIQADPNHVREILINVLQNALDVLPEKGGIIRCNLASLSESESILRIEDNGSGIPAAMQKEIFNPFFTTRTQGTGLGLPIARTLARANHGDLILDKSDKNGTIFSIVFKNAK